MIITEQHLQTIAGIKTPLMPLIAAEVTDQAAQYEIDTTQEFAHFLAQACHETDHFNTLREYASGNAYEGRLDLGNVQPGDGVRYRGRGIFQTTGRSNYAALGIASGLPNQFLVSPTELEQPHWAVWSALQYWKTRGLNDIANHADSDLLNKKYRGQIIQVSPIEFISITINGGYNGMEQRKQFYANARKAFGI